VGVSHPQPMIPLRATEWTSKGSKWLLIGKCIGGGFEASQLDCVAVGGPTSPL